MDDIDNTEGEIANDFPESADILHLSPSHCREELLERIGNASGYIRMCGTHTLVDGRCRTVELKTASASARTGWPIPINTQVTTKQGTIRIGTPKWLAVINNSRPHAGSER